MDVSSGGLVSVVVATNRGGRFLAEGLESVFGQTYRRFEVVLVDDGSPDPSTIREYGRQFPAVTIVRIPPSGVSAARNVGAAHTRGELLAFLDDDDRWHPGRLAAHIAALEERPQAVVSYCQMHTIDATGRRLVAADQRPARGPADVIRGHTGIMLPNLVIRRDAFTTIGGFDPDYRQGEDLDLVLKAVSLGSFAFVPTPLVDYRHHGSNTTRSHRHLAASLRTILRRHRAEAFATGRSDLVAAYSARLRANDRFAAWSAARAARAHLHQRHWAAGLAEVVWAAGFAPLAPLSWLQTRLSSSAGRHR